MLLFAVSAILVTFSCNSKKDKVEAENKELPLDPRESATMQRTMTDTLAVLYNTKQYLRLLQENKVDSALAMLYEASGDTVVPLSEVHKAEVLQNIQNFPVRKYKIDRLEMFSETDTEVYYTIEYFEKPESDPRPNTLQCVLAPKRVGYYWYLTIPHTTYDPVDKE